MATKPTFIEKLYTVSELCVNDDGSVDRSRSQSMYQCMRKGYIPHTHIAGPTSKMMTAEQYKEWTSGHYAPDTLDDNGIPLPCVLCQLPKNDVANVTQIRDLSS